MSNDTGKEELEALVEDDEFEEFEEGTFFLALIPY